MKVVYLHQYFKTNASAGGTRSYEFSMHLLEQGIDVNIITGMKADPEEEDLKNKVFSTGTRYHNTMSKWRRIFAFLEYNLKAVSMGKKIRDGDLIFATSTPLTIGLPGVWLSKKLKKPLVFEVRDVWPDVPVELGYIKNPLLIKVLKKFELWIYNNAEHVIVLSEGMKKNLLKKGVVGKKLTVIENMANLSLYENYRDEKPKDTFTCIHPGTMGHVNGLDFVLDAAKILMEKDSEIRIDLIGEGKEKNRLRQRVEAEGITNVSIRDAMPKKEVVRQIQKAHVGIMCVDNRYPILEDNSANKFFDFLAAGLPIMINYKGWQKEALEEHRCGGAYLTPGEMAEGILELKGNPELQKNLGENSRKLAEEAYSDLLAKEKFEAVIRAAAENRTNQ